MPAEVYDIECFPNFFSYSGLNKTTGEIVQFYIFNGADELEKLYNYIWVDKKVTHQIGFNNLNYDYPMLHFIYQNYETLRKQKPEKVTAKLYKRSQEIIATEFSAIRHHWVTVPQLDLYRIYHFDNKAKRTSLKDIEIALNFPVVQDIPFNYDHTVEKDEIADILKYNLNDVQATYAFYLKSKDRIVMRDSLSREFDLDLLNANDPKIGSEIFISLIAKQSGTELDEIKKMRTSRDKIDLGDCVLPTIGFKCPEFSNLLRTIKATTITETKDSMDHSVVYKGFKYDFGLGGIHGCITAGIYVSDDDHYVYDIDVTSFYPNLSIVYGFHPEHFGSAFCDIYKSVFDKRSAAKKAGNKVVNEGLKLALNGVFGKSNSEFSPFYDPKFTMQITVNGQLLIAMLAKALADLGVTILQANTDGITIKCHKDTFDRVQQICTRWEQGTKLQLEYKHYTKMVIRDVNNYMAIDTDGKVKYKGCFEIDKEYHKDPSFKVVTIALSEFYTNGTPVKETIEKHTNIYDFCGRFKGRQDSYGEIRYLKDDVLIKQRMQKTNRYFVSKNGQNFIKIYADGSEENIQRGWLVTIFNTYEEKPFHEYDIDYHFYITQCQKIMDTVQSKQMSLF